MPNASNEITPIPPPVTTKRRRGSGKKERFWSRINKNGPLPDQSKYPGLDKCWLWTAYIDKDGYGGVSVKSPKDATVGAHRVSYLRNVGPIPDGLCVLHKCDNRPCVNPNHLFLGTRADNCNDMRSKARDSRGPNHANKTRGERHWGAKLSDLSIATIRAAYKPGRTTLKTIASQYGVSISCISRAVRKDCWAHIL